MAESVNHESILESIDEASGFGEILPFLKRAYDSDMSVDQYDFVLSVVEKQTGRHFEKVTAEQTDSLVRALNLGLFSSDPILDRRAEIRCRTLLSERESATYEKLGCEWGSW